jgi:ribosome maturation factor RimP
MAGMSQVDRLRVLAVPAVRSAGLVLEELTVAPVGRRRLLRITVDLPEDVRGGVPMDAVAAASQAISQALDDSDVMGQKPYVLEVSSPGAERPLVEPRHWKRARGRLVDTRLADGRQVQGRLTEVTSDGPVVGGVRLTWGEVAGGRIQVEFGRLPGDGSEFEDDVDEQADDVDERADDVDEQADDVDERADDVDEGTDGQGDTAEGSA